jgi:HTH-type transcriptional regulator/antitoxin HigA
MQQPPTRVKGGETEGTMAKRSLDFSKPHVLRNEREYDAAVAEVERLFELDPAPGTEEYERLQFLALLVETYEEEHYPMEGSTPQSVVEFMLEQKGMERSDLNRLMGGKSRVSEFFSGKRELSISQIKVLRDVLGIPADLLVEGGGAKPRKGKGAGSGGERPASNRRKRGPRG